MYLNILFSVAMCLLISCGSMNKTNKSKDTSASPRAKKHVQAIELDALKGLYLVYTDKIEKVNQNQVALFSYSDEAKGEILMLDASNPQKIVVLHAGSLVVFLDNTLSVISSVDLKKLGYNDVERVALAENGNLWLFDPNESKLLQLDTKGTSVYQSNALYDLKIEVDKVVDIQAGGGDVALLTDREMVVFDNYGSYKYHYNVNPGVTCLTMVADKMVYIDLDTKTRYDSSISSGMGMDYVLDDLKDVQNIKQMIAVGTAEYILYKDGRVVKF